MRALLRVSVLLVAAPVWAAAQSPPATAPQPAAVGTDTCLTCHEDKAASFKASTHGSLAAFESRGPLVGCEACHGAGNVHAESGDAASIRSFRGDATPDDNQTCLACHRKDHAMQWAGSTHASSGVGCTACHTIHPKASARRVITPVTTTSAMPSRATSPSEKCLSCHKEQQAKFLMSSRHPVREGRMSCASCHDPHGSGLRNVKTLERPNELCTSCHASKAGPFVFEHAPVQESCLTCHDPHGTVANKLLRQSEPFLCLQCHEMHFHSARVAPSVPAGFGNTYSTNPNGRTGFMGAFNTRCSNCHSRIHGSDLPSQGVTGRGKALTR